MEREHGTRQRYWQGCRCPECKAAGSAYNRATRIGICKICGGEAWTGDRWSEGRCRVCANRERNWR